MLRTTLEAMTSARVTRNDTVARFTCKFCHKVFVLEPRYMSHMCKQMKRDEEFRTPTGQAAWHYYQLWMRNMKRLPPPGASFIASKYFRTFINFTNFAKRVELPRPEKFVWLMVTKDYPPTIWMNDEVYVIYIEWLDIKAEPIEQATLSIQTLIALTDTKNVPIQEIFNQLTVQEIIHLLHARKLSPWLLLFSKSFKNVLVLRASLEQQIILQNLIRPEYWPSQFEKFPDDVVTIKTLIREMGI